MSRDNQLVQELKLSSHTSAASGHMYTRNLLPTTKHRLCLVIVWVQTWHRTLSVRCRSPSDWREDPWLCQSGMLIQHAGDNMQRPAGPASTKPVTRPPALIHGICSTSNHMLSLTSLVKCRCMLWSWSGWRHGSCLPQKPDSSFEDLQVVYVYRPEVKLIVFTAQASSRESNTLRQTYMSYIRQPCKLYSSQKPEPLGALPIPHATTQLLNGSTSVPSHCCWEQSNRRSTCCVYVEQFNCCCF